MKVLTDYLWFTTKKRQEFVRITDDVAGIVNLPGSRRAAANERGERSGHARGRPAVGDSRSGRG